MPDIYEIVTNRIIEQLDKGIVPWRKPWAIKKAVNYVTGKPYRGINMLLLDEGEYASFNQIKKAGGKVKKGAKSEIVVFYQAIEKKSKDEVDENGDPVIVTKRIFRYTPVFKIGEQTEGLELRHTDKQISTIISGEQVSKSYLTRENISVSSGKKASYSPKEDKITVPHISNFDSSSDYYATLYHEMVHSTGHESRLKRDIKNKFGDDKYSKEELIAELGGAFLCAETGIKIDYTNTSAYIGSWKKRLKEDKSLIVCASKQAQKAVKLILGETTSENESGGN